MDTYSEAWRHHCEVRAVLLMPVGQRRGYFDLVGKRRGPVAAQTLRNDVYNTWVSRQVDALAAMCEDDRETRLMAIQNSSNARTRATVEKALKGRLSANENERDV
jgi:hypothetical protein